MHITPQLEMDLFAQVVTILKIAKLDLPKLPEHFRAWRNLNVQAVKQHTKKGA